MVFSKEWENLYQTEQHASVWPWSDVVSLVMRFAPPQDTKYRVLEIGVGAGANIPFFLNLDVEYWAIEGSQTAVGRLQAAYPKIQSQLLIGDFTESLEAPGKFDLILDRSSLTHNPTSAIRRALGLVHDKLIDRGNFIGIDWFSTEFSEYANGLDGEDTYTRKNFSEGRLSGTGTVHFSDEAHLIELLNDFNVRHLEHKITKQYLPDQAGQFAAWNFVAGK